MELEKITDQTSTSRKRGFHDACGMAHGLELLGDRWALFVVRELMLGPRRFGDLRADLPGISANVLTQRLGELEARGIIERSRLPPPANVPVYGLTKWGYEAEPVIQQLGRWAARSPAHDPTLPVSAVAVLLSLRTMVNRRAIGGLNLTIAFHLRGQDHQARLDASGIVIAQGRAEAADIGFAGSPEAFAAFIYGGVPADALAGALDVTGDPALVARFAGIFQLPPKFHPPRQEAVAPA